MLYFCDTALHTSIFKMPKGDKNMENKSDEQFIIMKAVIEANKQEMKANNQDSDEKMTKLSE